MIDNRFVQMSSLLDPAKNKKRGMERYAGSFSAVDYTVSGIISPLRQPTGMVCWATVATMMISWRNQRSSSIETAMGNVGATYVAKVRANSGLSVSEKPSFLSTVGLTFEYPQSLSIGGWETMLRNYGPIWITTAEGSDSSFGIHARILSGIRGDGTPEGTNLSITDPGNGTTYSEKFADFLVKFEREVRVDSNWDGRIQIVHWPSTGSGSQSMSINPAMTISSAGVDLIKRLEHFEPRLYNDQAGHCTIGYGTLLHRGSCNGDSSEQPFTGGITEQRATELLMNEVSVFQGTINDLVNVTLNQNQFDSLISFCYNIGAGAFRGSTLLRMLNQCNYTSVPTEMRKWVKVRIGGMLKDSRGLINRRNAEIELFNIPVAGTSQSMSMTWGGLSADFTVQSDFISQYSQNAIDSMRQTRVPASATLAQAALESGWGKHAPGFNFFGIKAGSSWTGQTQLLTTTEIHNDNDRSRHPYPEIISIEQFTDANGATKYRWRVRDTFRAYASATESFNDHGNFLVNNGRYHEAFNHTDDSIRFIREIAAAGYATDPGYASSLISIVNHNNLIQYDTPPAPVAAPAPKAQSMDYYYSSLFSVGGVVSGGLITQGFFRNRAETIPQHKGDGQSHLGIDVSLSNNSGAGATDSRRGFPVNAAIRTSIPLAELNSVRINPSGNGMGLNGTGNADLQQVKVDVQQWDSPDMAYGGVIGLACHYSYANSSGSTEYVTLYVEFLHLITENHPPKDGSNHIIPIAEYNAAHPGRIGFGPQMLQGAVLPASAFTPGNVPVIGYLGATQFPHCHIQAAFAHGRTGYIRTVRFNPEVMLS